ncbi:MAG: glycosyltransferase, partial [Gemmatimonadales bacterium]
YVGRIKRYKGLEIVIRALGAPQLADSGVRLAIAGTGDDRGRLSRVAQQCGVAGAVDFLGFVSEEKKRDLLRKAWAVVFPSAKEGWGITNIEAAACGTPTISSDAPGLRETARDGETGVLVPHGDVHAFAAAMRRISSDRDLVTSLGGQARHFAETFSWDSAAGQTETHLLETIQSFQTDTR